MITNHNNRRGYTLVELIASMGAATVLLLGLTSSLVIASKAFDGNSSGAFKRASAADVQADMMSDLRNATSFSERTATAVTFTVPDRTGDNTPDTIRYAWSGTPGDPLTYAFNAGTAVDLVGDVQAFDLSFLTRLMSASFIKPSNILFVSDGSIPNSAEQLRITLIESWGYTVATIQDTATQSAFDSAFLSNDVIYVSMAVKKSDLAWKLLDAPIGIVNENFGQPKLFGLAKKNADHTVRDIKIVDNTHYITEVFSLGTLQIFTSNQQVRSLKPALAGGLQSLGEYLDGLTWRPTLAVLDLGANRFGGGISTSRRVQLPWGRGGFDFSKLKADGKTIMQRSIDWAGEQSAGGGLGAGGETILFANTINFPNAKDFSVKATKWGGQYFKPTLPGSATSWSITRVKFRAKRDKNNLPFYLQIRTADGSLKPTNTIIESVSMNSRNLVKNNYQWYEVNFTNVTGLDPSVGYYFVFAAPKDKPVRVEVENNSAASGTHWVTTKNSGSNWSNTNAGKDTSIIVYGTYSK